MTTTMSDKMVAMTFVEDLGRVGGKTVGGHLLVGYDDVKSVQYFKQNLVPIGRRNFRQSNWLLQMLKKIMQKP